MIEQLLRCKETIDYPKNSTIKLHRNNEHEDYPLHWHSSVEIIIPQNSIYTVICNETTYTLHEQDILIIASGVMHQIQAPESGCRYILQFDLSPFISYKEIDLLLSEIPPVILLTKESNIKLYQNVNKLMQSIISEYHTDLSYKQTMIYSKLLALLTLLARHKPNNKLIHTNTKNKELEYYRLYLMICDYIQINYARNITLDEVATLAGFSKYHFTRVFRHYANMSFYQYMNKVRMEHASTLLKDSNLSVHDVATHSGFTNLSAFIRMFKLHYETTPTEYKKNYSLTKRSK